MAEKSKNALGKNGIALFKTAALRLPITQFFRTLSVTVFCFYERQVILSGTTEQSEVPPVFTKQFTSTIMAKKSKNARGKYRKV